MISARRFSQSAAVRTFEPFRNVNGSGRWLIAARSYGSGYLPLRRNPLSAASSAVLALSMSGCALARRSAASAAASARSTADSSFQIPRTSPVAEVVEAVAFLTFCCSMYVFGGMREDASYPARTTSPHIVLSLVPLFCPLLQYSWY